MPVAGLLSGAGALAGGISGAFQSPPDITTVSPDVTLDNAAPFAVGHGARAVPASVGVDPKSPILDFEGAPVASASAIVLVAAVIGAVIVLRRR